jgi:hypothetical protein
MSEYFNPSQPTGKSSEPDSPLHDEKPSNETDRKDDATCTYGGSTYNKGATICINHDQYQCGNSGWFKNGSKC